MEYIRKLQMLFIWKEGKMEKIVKGMRKEEW